MKKILCILCASAASIFGSAALCAQDVAGGPAGGDVHNLVVVPGTPATVLISLIRGGVHRSVDGGSSWRLSNDGLPDSVEIALDPLNRNLVLARGFDGRLYRSRDRGRRWIPAGKGELPRKAFAVDPNHPSIRYKGTESGVSKSIDAGRTWQPINQGLPEDVGVDSLAIDSSNPAVLFAGLRNKSMFKTTTAGRVWKQVDGEFPQDVQEIAVTADSRTAYAFAGAMFRSADAGEHWMPIGTHLPSVFAFGVEPKSGAVYAGTDAGVFVTTDTGEHWTPMNSGLGRTWVTVAVKPTSPPLLFAVFGFRQVYVSRDRGESWSDSLAGRVAADLRWSRAFVVGAGSVRMDGWDGVVVNRGSRDEWTAIKTPMPPQDSCVLPSDAGPMFSGCGAERLMSVDGGRTWSPLPLPGRGGMSTVYARDRTTFYVSRWFQGVQETKDGGQTWSPWFTLEPHGLQFQPLFDPNQPDTAYVFAGGLYVESSEGDLYRTADGGRSWKPVQLSAAGKRPIDFVTLIPAEPAILYAGVWDQAGRSYHLWRSRDGGATWMRSDTGLPPQVSVTSVVALPGDPSVLFAGTGGRGVFRSVDGGATWQPTSAK